jgi:hypothetical protein
MNKAENRFSQLKKQRENRLQGKHTIIPFNFHFPKLSKYIPGIFKEAIFGILAGSGDGKTKLTKYLTIIVPYLLNLSHGIKFKTIYFALEESEEEFIDHLTLLLLNERFGIEIDYHDLNSYREELISQDTLDKMYSLAPEINKIMSHVYIHDDISHPTGMFLKCKEYAEQWGKMVDGKYVPNDDEEFVIVVCDHVSLISKEYDSKLKQTLNKHEALAKWSTDYCLKVITKKFKWTVFNVQQTTMTSEGSEKKKLNTLEPAPEDLATNKELYRDMKVLLALFSPFKNKIADYRGYKIATKGGSGLRDSYRNLGILKNRYGPPGINIGLHFDGATGKYTELDREDQEKHFIKL